MTFRETGQAYARPARDSVIEVAVIRSEVQDGERREQVLSERVRPSGNIPKLIREMTGIMNEIVVNADTRDRVLAVAPRRMVTDRRQRWRTRT